MGFRSFELGLNSSPVQDDQLKVLQKLLAKNGIHDFKFGSNKELQALVFYLRRKKTTLTYIELACSKLFVCQELSDSLQKAVKPEESRGSHFGSMPEHDRCRTRSSIRWSGS